MRGPVQLSAAFLPLSVLFRDSMTAVNGSPIVDGPEVYEDRDSAQREAEGPSSLVPRPFLRTREEFEIRGRRKARERVWQIE